MRRAATAQSQDQRIEAIRQTRVALDSAKRAIESYASVAKDRSDIAAIAMLNEYVYHPLQAKLADLKQ